MTGRMRFIVALGALLAASACATDIPATRGFAPSTQTKLRASHHWDLVAADIAKQVKASLNRVAPGAPVYLEPPAAPTPFETALHDFLATRLIDDGATVELRPQGALHLYVHTQLVTNVSPRRTFNVPLVAIAAGVVAAYNIGEHAYRDVKGAALVGAAAGYDAASGTFSGAGSPSRTELIVTTSLSNSAQYLMRKTDVYYIEDADLSLFAPPPAATPTREYRVEGGQ